MASFQSRKTSRVVVKDCSISWILSNVVFQYPIPPIWNHFVFSSSRFLSSWQTLRYFNFVLGIIRRLASDILNPGRFNFSRFLFFKINFLNIAFVNQSHWTKLTFLKLIEYRVKNLNSSCLWLFKSDQETEWSHPLIPTLSFMFKYLHIFKKYWTSRLIFLFIWKKIAKLFELRNPKSIKITSSGRSLKVAVL